MPQDLPADLFAVLAKVNKPLRVYAQNAKALALMAEALEQPHSELPPSVTSRAEISRRVMVCRAGTRPHVTRRGRRGRRAG